MLVATGTGPSGETATRTDDEGDQALLVAFSISPSAADETGSVSEAVAAATKVVRDSGLPWELTSMFTTVEGEWDEVMAVVKRAVLTVAETSPRVGLVLKADLRAGHDTGQLAAKVERVEQLLRVTS